MMNKQTETLNTSYKLTPYDKRLIEFTGQSASEIELYMKENTELKGMRIFDDAKPYSDISFLSEFTFLKRLDLFCIKDHDYSFLDNLVGLERLKIEAVVKPNSTIMLDKLKNLTYLGIYWRYKKICGLENLKALRTLDLFRYNEKRCKSLSMLSSLENVRIWESKLTSLEGLVTKNIRTAVFVYCNQLEDIAELENAPLLDVVVFDHCKKIDLELNETILKLRSRNIKILTDKNENIANSRFKNA